MRLFSKNLIDAEVAEWQFESYELLIDSFSSGPGLPDSHLWLPIGEHFDPVEHDGNMLRDAELAEHLFTRILQQCGFGDSHGIKLVPKEGPKTGFLDGGAILQTTGSGTCGLYEVKEVNNKFVETIYYDHSLLTQPNNLIATFAHELSHALHNRSAKRLEIEPELYELFTDLTAIYLGYGIFQANSRFEFRSSNQGWQASGAGYLPEFDMIFALAIFMSIKNMTPNDVKAYLKPNLLRMLNKAFKQLRHYKPEIDKLRSHLPSSLKVKSSSNT